MTGITKLVVRGSIEEVDVIDFRKKFALVTEVGRTRRHSSPILVVERIKGGPA